jgi:putative membrane protein
MWWGHPFNINFGLVMVALMVIFWGAIIALAVWGIKRLTKCSSGSNSNALDIVRERYARGEINREQFEELKKDLS